jgi:RNA polymerase sigma-54 factor
MNAPALKFDTRQTQTLTPRLQYAVRLLQLSSLDYEQELQEVMGKNPFLEVERSEQTQSTEPDSPWTVAGAPGADPDGPAGTDSADAAPDGGGEVSLERDAQMQSPDGIRDGGGGSGASALDLMVADVGLRAHLHSQTNILPLSERDHTLVCAVIESLDDDGYLRTPLAEIGALAALQPTADACEMNTALKLVQSFDPVGIGARDIGECLALQLRQLTTLDGAQRALAERIVAEHLDRLAQRDANGLARLLGRPAAEIEIACAAIRRLDPRPGWRHGASDAQYIVPDVIVKKVRGVWTAQLNPAVVPRVQLNQSYAQLFQKHRDSRHAELAGHLQEARWAVKNVEQRFSTILSVAQAILRRQHLFFEYGAFAMKPLGLREVADEVGLHESTVCRVTNNKFMSTPAGVLELKHFFSRPMPMASGGACSATAIRGVVKELIDAEDPTAPLSDVDIAQKLARQGLTVARRTVTKYRQMLKLPSVELRRRVGATAGVTRGVRAARKPADPGAEARA